MTATTPAPPTRPPLEPPPPAPPTPVRQTWPPPSPRERVLNRRDRTIRLACVAGAVAIVVASLLIDRSPLGVILALFVLVVPFEKLVPRHRGQPLRRPQVASDIGYALASPLLNTVGIAIAILVGFVTLAWVPGLALRPLVTMLPSGVKALVGIALFDLAIYWVHRWSHEVPLLWRFHAIHHSTEHLDWISGFRNHPFDGAIVAPPFFFLLAAGFSAEFTGALAIIQAIAGIFLHANVRWRLRPIHRVVITPEFHHWHHTNDPKAIHSNYSVFLPLWDQLFGTYFMPKHRRPTVYGVDEYIPTGMVAQLLHPFRDAGTSRHHLRHPIAASKAAARLAATVAVDVKASTFRPTHRLR